VSRHLITTFLPTAFVEFRAVLARQIKALNTQYPEPHSTTWFFLRYLRRVARRAEAGVSPRECNSAMRGLIRFYIDCIDPTSDLAWRFEEVLDAHRKALRYEHTH
jgi:hypothetical protein